VGRALRVLVVDDQPPFRRAARAVLEIARSFEIVGEVTSGEEAVDAAAALRPDLVVMDVQMAGIGGIEATRQIVATRPETIVVLVSSYRPEDVTKVVAESGARGFVAKDRFSASALEDLLQARAGDPLPTGTRAPPSRDG
jgi:two-component system, NarL family, invasion response regulator UvrY